MNRYLYVALALLIIIVTYAYMQQLNSNADDNINDTASETVDNSLTKNYSDQLHALISSYDKNLQYRDKQLNKRGFVKAENVNIRSQPNTDATSSILTTVAQEEQLQIINEDTHWYQIHYDGFEGWIYKDYVQPTTIVQTENGSTLELTFSSNNILEINGEGADSFSLINDATGKYVLSSDDLRFSDHIFDLNHPSIPIIATKTQQIEIYTESWSYAKALNVSDKQTQIVFTPTIFDITYRCEADRDIYEFHTSGAPEYQFTEQPDSLHLVFSPGTEAAFTLPQTEKNMWLESLSQNHHEWTFTAKEPVNWKISSSDNSITVDISKRGIAGKRIVVDPGHGGKEKGTYGRKSEIREKDTNLALSQHFVQALTDLGADVTVTRASDTIVYTGENYTTFLDLMARVDIAKQRQADLFISLHADNFPADLSIQGTTAYYYSRYPHAAQNQKLAELIGKTVSETAGTRWLGAKEQTFAVIRYNPYPAVLIEYGFLSNAEDEAKLIDPVYQKKMADATAQAIADYYK